MECNYIISMETMLLITRAKTWLSQKIGKDQQVFLATPAGEQERLLDTCLRFTSSIMIALDLNLCILDQMNVVKEFLVKSARMVEILARNTSTPTKIKHDVDTSASNMRQNFQTALRLYKFLISNDYIAHAQKDRATFNESDYLLQLGAPALCLWGESLISFAETSLKFWKTEYISALRLAELVLNKCLVLEPKCAQAYYLVGRAILHVAKSEMTSTADSTYQGLLQKSKQAFVNAVQLFPVKVYQYALIRVCALLNQEEECRCLLQAIYFTEREGCLALLDEPDFDQFRTRDWFYEIVGKADSAYEKKMTSPPALPPPSSFPSLQSLVSSLPDSIAKMSVTSSPARATTIAAASDKPPPQITQQTAQQNYQAHLEAHKRLEKENPYLFKSGMEDRQYNNLQSSLIMNGFSMKKLLEVFNWLPVSSGILQKHPEEEENEHVKKQKVRLQQRLELYQLKMKKEVPGDGNCQMHAISDQLYDTFDQSTEIRRAVVDWLRKNKNWQLPNESVLHQFVHDRPWEQYCDMMAKDGCWGDHLTLLAISEIFGVTISVLSSVEGDSFITEIHPTVKKTSKVLLLSHFAEFHYGSLTHLEETPK